jgi:hypothetical protein
MPCPVAPYLVPCPARRDPSLCRWAADREGRAELLREAARAAERDEARRRQPGAPP